MQARPSVRRDTRAWKAAGLVSFGLSASPLRDRPRLAARPDLDRAFMVMGYVFCLSAAFALAKFVRDNERRRATRRCGRRVVWSGFASRWRSPPGACGAWRSTRPRRPTSGVLAVPHLERVHARQDAARRSSRPTCSMRASPDDATAIALTDPRSADHLSRLSSQGSVMASLRRRRRARPVPARHHRSTPIRNELSDASALSALPVAVSVAAPAMVLSAGAAFTVVAVDASAAGTVWVLERASDGARATSSFRASAAGAVAGGLGTAVAGHRAERRLGAVGRGPGDRLHPERARRRAALQRAGDAMNRAASLAAALFVRRWRCARGARGPPVRDSSRSMPAPSHAAWRSPNRTASASMRSGAQVVLLARAGQDLGKYGLTLFAPRLRLPRRRAGPRRGAWCTSSTTAAPRDGGAVPPGPGRVLPRPAAPLRGRLSSCCRPRRRRGCCRCCATTRALAALAHAALQHGRVPVGAAYQQCNQWAIETLAGAHGAGGDHASQAQAWLQLHGYQPTDAAPRRADAPGRARHRGQHRFRRPSGRQALQPTASRP